MYIDAKRIEKKIFVAERDALGVRSVYTHQPEWAFYYPDPSGPHKTIDGQTVSKFSTDNFFKFRETRDEWQAAGTLYESDIDPVYRMLEKYYPGDDGPKLNVSMLDIEVDKDPERGYATIANPYAEINAISIYNKWNKEAITLLVAPENLTREECRDLLDGKLFQDAEGNLTTERPEGDDFEPMTADAGYFLVENEAELLLLTLDMIEDADIISGWNSTFFDIPYMVQRMRIVLGGESIASLAAENGTPDGRYNPPEASQIHINRLNLFPCPPSMRFVEHFGTMEKVYQLHGRLHLDYLELYRKFTYEELHSYALDFILQKEVDQQKIAYQGSLDQLYRWDFRRFSAYSRQDTMGLSAIDDKKKLIDLANSMAHMAGVTIDKVLGSVVLIEQALLKELHKQDLICFDKVEHSKDYPIPGAFVLEPQKGSYNWIASYDFNSLYPTVIRMLNISPECIMGWVKPTETLQSLNRLMHEEGMEGAEAWAHFPGTIEYRRVIENSDEEIEFLIEGAFIDITDPITGLVRRENDSEKMSGKEMNAAIRENNWVITAFGLVLSRDKQGIIPYCLEKWYDERVIYKTKASVAYKAAYKLDKDDPQRATLMDEFIYYDMLQLVQKIFLNSTYGALLNAFCRFYDPRMGASVTMSGRICLQAMADRAEEILESGDIA